MDRADVSEAAAHLGELIAAAQRGEEVVITCDGVPAAKLVPVSAKPSRREGGWLEDQIVVTDVDWWKPDDHLADLFENGDPDHPDPLPPSYPRRP